MSIVYLLPKIEKEYERYERKLVLIQEENKRKKTEQKENFRSLN